MKADIHPKYYQDAKVTCACGNSFTTGSTLPELSVEICSNCHPFFTGEMRLVDTQGRIERFQEKQRKAASGSFKKKPQKDRALGDRPKSLKEMLSVREGNSGPTRSKKTKPSKQ